MSKPIGARIPNRKSANGKYRKKKIPNKDINSGIATVMKSILKRIFDK